MHHGLIAEQAEDAIVEAAGVELGEAEGAPVDKSAEVGVGEAIDELPLVGVFQEVVLLPVGREVVIGNEVDDALTSAR